MGLMEEPRYIIKHVCNHFYEMPEETIREKLFAVAAGQALMPGKTWNSVYGEDSPRHCG